MADVFSPEKRSQIMSKIKGKDTKPEILIRSGLHRKGLRFRLHDCQLPGKPDVTLPKYKAVIFVHGCFWHGHECHLFKWPSTRPDFWKEKINRNRYLDALHISALKEMGWRVCVVWECSIRGKQSIGMDTVIDTCERWIKSESLFLAVIGQDKKDGA